MIWQCRNRRFDLANRTLIMGVLNVTPDSFSDGGKYATADAAIARGMELAAQGADIIDIGGESTRPGAEPVPAEEETRRVLPVIEVLAGKTSAAISIDTCKSAVARAALGAGADIVNDITALGGDPLMARIVAESGAGLVLMHMQGTPQTMQIAPHYGDVVREVKEFLLEREAAAIDAGVARECIAFDPGIGFGKTAEHNMQLLRKVEEFASLGRPLLMGVSRKSTIRKIVGEGPGPVEPTSGESLFGTAAAVAICVARGASIVRVHDVEQMKSVARVATEFRLRD
jgi:dihydropteroate synthase